MLEKKSPITPTLIEYRRLYVRGNRVGLTAMLFNWGGKNLISTYLPIEGIMKEIAADRLT